MDKAITAKTKDTSGSGGSDPSGSSAPADGGGSTDPSGERCRSGKLLRGLGSGLYGSEEVGSLEGGGGIDGGGAAGTSYSRRWRGHSGWPHGLMVRWPATSGVLSQEKSGPGVRVWLAEPTLESPG